VALAQLGLVLACASLLAPEAGGAEGGPARAAETPRTAGVAAGPRYRAGGLHRALLGSDYRDLWTLPIEAPLLHLRTEAGGLVPVRRVGGQQTMGLALRGADGRDYTFRGVDKDPTSVLPPDLEGTLADRVVQDQVASGHPAAPLIVAPLAAAAGVLHVEPRLVVMPDDETLGEFRRDFAGLLGTFEEFPGPGFAGATAVFSGEEMWARRDRGEPLRVDAVAFLRARLLDLFVGDWDRHRKQWRWVEVPGRAGLLPLPEDRDQAFSRFEGLLLQVARHAQPRFLDFGPDYPGIEGMAFNGWEQDRWLLSELAWPAWEATVRELRSAWSDAVLDKAASRMPPEYFRLDGARLASALEARRDRLPEIARSFFRHLNRQADVRLSDAAESVRVERRPDGSVEVTAMRVDTPEPVFRRVFEPEDTREVRLDLRGGDDVVATSGPRGRMVVRVVGGRGDDRLDDTASGGTLFSDSAGRDTVRAGPGTRWDRREYVPPPANPRAPWIPPRDWGRRTVPTLWIAGGPDAGVFVGGGLLTTGYGFRQDPYADRQLLRAGWAFGASAGRLDWEGTFPRRNSGDAWTLAARASGIEVLRFYGFGNDTSDEGPDRFFRVRQQQARLEAARHWGLGRRASFFAGPAVQFATTRDDRDRLIGQARPYGSGDFGQVGALVGLRVDTRDRPVAPQTGFRLSVRARAFPAVWSVRDAFGSLEGETAAYLGGAGATLALRAGANRVFGTYPFHEAAFIGGPASVRGFRANRFAGDGALYGNAELRLRVAPFFLFFPGEIGVFGLGDAGRVYVEGEESRSWHTAWGGGVWLSFLGRANTLSVAVARSPERTGAYVRAGFAF
jgi:hypothetical protein